jgi:cell division septation protein DedD
VRNLFLVLLLVNLGVFAWYSWIVPAPSVATPYNGPGITLLRELEPDTPILAASRPPDAVPPISSALPIEEDPAFTAQAPADSPAAEEAVPAAATTKCVAIGPFTEAAQAELAQATLGEAGFAASLAVSQEQVWDGYWVFIGGLPGMDRAQAVLADLATSGIADAYVIPNSDSGILISLGVFSDIARAGTQAERAGRLGFAATITERTRSAETHWLELLLSGEESQALELLQEPGRISRLGQRECESRDSV